MKRNQDAAWGALEGVFERWSSACLRAEPFVLHVAKLLAGVPSSWSGIVGRRPPF